MERLEKALDKYAIAVLAGAVILSSWALLVPGFYGASDEVHVAWLQQMDASLKSGQLPPRYVPDLSYKFGYPLFNFVFPLPYYVGEIFHLLGFGFVDSVKLVFLLSNVALVVSMYLLARVFTGRLMSSIVAFLYAMAPYHAVDLYIRGAIGEVVAMAIFPFIVLFLLKIFGGSKSQGERIVYTLLGSLVVAALVLSHNISAYMFVPAVFLLAFLMTIFQRENRWPKALCALLMFILGMLESVYFWLPAIWESNLVKYDTVFNFADHFPTLLQLVWPYWGYGASVPGPGDGMSFFLGLGAILVVVVSGIVTALRFSRFSTLERVFLVWLFVCVLFSVFLMNYRSVFVWINVPMLAYFQFPWRFLLVVSFCIPLLLISVYRLKFSYFFGIGLLGFVVVSNFSYFRPQDFLGRGDDYFLNKYIPNEELSAEYKYNQEEYLRLPRHTLSRPDKLYDLFFSDGGVVFKTEKYDGVNFKGKLSTDMQQIVSYAKYDFPGWEVFIDGVSVPHNTGGGLGQISFMLPKGDHQVEVSFGETGFRKVVDTLSLLSFVLVIAMFVRYTIASLNRVRRRE